MAKKHIFASKEASPPTEGSCRFPLIVFQQTTQPFLATHNSVIHARPSIRQWEQKLVLLALVIALLVVERLCGTLGEIGETGMPVEADLVRGEAAAPSCSNM
jgi:hypothetical protein